MVIKNSILKTDLDIMDHMVVSNYRFHIIVIAYKIYIIHIYMYIYVCVCVYVCVLLCYECYISKTESFFYWMSRLLIITPYRLESLRNSYSIEFNFLTSYKQELYI